MSNELTTTAAASLERVLVAGDLGKLSEQDRLGYYKAVCESLGLNPLTKPFDYITLNGKLTLYARKDATDQLRRKNRVSITDLEESERHGVYVVTAKAQDADGRTDASKGCVNVQGLKGDALANAMMKAETKAKRRVTLSICGLGMLDETEVETIPTARAHVTQTNTHALPSPAENGELTQAELDSANARDYYCHLFDQCKTRDELVELKARVLSASQNGQFIGDAYSEVEKAYNRAVERLRPKGKSVPEPEPVTQGKDTGGGNEDSIPCILIPPKRDG